MSDLGQRVTFKGPGQWRSQADAAQAGSRPPDAVLNPSLPAKGPAAGTIARGLDWDDGEYLLTREEHWDPKLHPRAGHGKFAAVPGGSHPVDPAHLADSGPASVETGQVRALAQASSATEAALSARMAAMDATHRAEMAKITAEMRQVHQDLTEAAGAEQHAEERTKSLKKLAHHFLMLVMTGIGLFLSTKYDVGSGGEIAATVGPLALQGVLDFVRHA